MSYDTWPFVTQGEMDASLEPRKMFVGGLSWDTSNESLKEYFEKFGSVHEAVVMRNQPLNKPRGFGFVTFEFQDSIVKVLESGPHVIDGKQVDPKRATTKSQFAPQQDPAAIERRKKIFIGGLNPASTEDDIRTYFSVHGKVEDVTLKFDKTTGRMKGFGFVAFDSEVVADKMCQIHFHTISDKMVEAKQMQPPAQAAAMKQSLQQAYPGGGTYNTAYTAAAAAGYQQGYQPQPYPYAGFYPGRVYSDSSGQQAVGYAQENSYTGSTGYTQSSAGAYGGAQNAYGYDANQIAYAAAYQQHTQATPMATPVSNYGVSTGQQQPAQQLQTRKF